MTQILKIVRMVKGLSPEVLSKSLGISVIEYLELECLVTRPSLGLLKQLANYYNLPIYYFESDRKSSIKFNRQCLKRRLASLKKQHASKMAYDYPNEDEQQQQSSPPEMEILGELLESVARQLELTEHLIALIDLYKQSGKQIII